MFWAALRSPVSLVISRNLQSFSRCYVNHFNLRYLSKFAGGGPELQNRNLVSPDLLKTMKLFMDKGNPFALKVLSACNVSNVEMQIELVDKQCSEKPRSMKKHQLPFLEVEPGQYLFDANAMCCFIMDKKDGSDSKNPSVTMQLDELIEWDSTFLQPTLLPYLVSKASSSNKDESLPANVGNALATLNEYLSKKPYLLGSSISVADIIVWGSVFGVLHGKEKCKDITTKYGSLVTWFHTLSSQAAFAKAIASVTEGKGVDSFKDSLRGYSLPPICSKLASMDGEESNRATSADNGGDEAVEGPNQAQIDSAKAAWVAGRTGIQKPRSYDPPVLPREKEKNFLITSALPYVNNVPHLGNIIGCVLSGDVYARYCRLQNYNALYICGTDEYGTATETKAIEEGLTPQQICDKYHKLHADIYKWFNIYFDHFGRTTTEQQTEIAQDIFWKIEKNKSLLQDTLEQLQCVNCKRFLADRFVEGTCPFCAYEDARGDQCDACGKLINAIELKSPRCKMCGSRPEIRTSKHIFLDLPKIEPQLRKWVDESIKQGNWSANSRNITKAWLQEGLKPRCITRDLKWGTAVPMEGFEDKVFYVWFDAPIGYISITANYTKEWEKWWKNPEQVQLVQFMAKDNVPFHTVVFPCSLIGADDNYTLLGDINATEYLNYEDDKFSKSRGVGVFGDNAKDTGIPADIFRFYLLYLRPESQDSAFCWADFVMRNNSELLNNLGNFVNRALMFLKNSFDSTVQEISLNEDDCIFLASINRELGSYIDHLEKIKLRDGLRIILSISKLGNQYMQANQPWVLVKGTEQEKARAGSVISLACNLSGLLAVLIKPYMPEISKEMQSQLQLPAENLIMVESFIPMLPGGHKIGNPNPLFQKIDTAFAEEMKAKFAGKRKENSSPKPGEVKKEQKDSTPQKENIHPTDIVSLEAEVEKQGAVVRKAKMEQASKDIVSKEVEKLLALKKSLALVKGEEPDSGKSKKKNKKK